jgi:hypothetical protein
MTILFHASMSRPWGISASFDLLCFGVGLHITAVSAGKIHKAIIILDSKVLHYSSDTLVVDCLDKTAD